MKSLFSFGTPAELVISITGEDSRRKEGELLVFTPTDDISGVLRVTAKKLDHGGVKVELIGVIQTTVDKGSQFEFTSSVRALSQSGTLDGSEEFPFAFVNVDKPHESYYGKSVKLRYFVRATVVRSYAPNLTKEQDFLVQSTDVAPELNSTIKMEVGIEDCLHIEFEYNKSKYHLQDVVVGKVFFLLVRIKITHMELAIVRRESSGSGLDKLTDTETVTKFEIMDGAPVKGESIPVRLFLGGVALTPTYKNVNNKFSVKYFLNLVLVDESDRRYFKQQEITLWRKRA
ncbi:hypothetical protein H310_00196 [Aphanomyces invadans]|uniref:Vacuolar protein sorting-associated protein 26 n=1 Tax=Aphanomyces invadans TaxID=157072 RepID=A0A024UVJ3_9STRA|nr:hypothetical protein H310_00196 [Aphanomyces invadans]ETW09683.1 hypothetical protein H310_00196 [Aphanomyces invadans]|eukprot:XP_008861094.1 hypothetical protein H310_00196 [Aphanomyces invadans]